MTDDRTLGQAVHRASRICGQVLDRQQALVTRGERPDAAQAARHALAGEILAALAGAQRPADDGAPGPSEPVLECTMCGCTDERACPGGCWWVHGPLDDPLCSGCARLAREGFGAEGVGRG